MSKLLPILTRSMTGYNKLQLSIVCDTEADKYNDKYIAFIKGIEAKKSDTGGLQFDYQNSINMKLTIEDLNALGFAAQKYAEGQFANYSKAFGDYQKFADSSRSSYANGGEGVKKTLKLTVYQDQKSNMITFKLTFGAGKFIGINFTPYSLSAFSKMCYQMADLMFQLESKRDDVEVSPPKTQSNGNYKNNKQENSYKKQAPTAQFGDGDAEFGDIANNFANTLNNMGSENDPPMIDAPF